jgi:hypothetical protein
MGYCRGCLRNGPLHRSILSNVVQEGIYPGFLNTRFGWAAVGNGIPCF